MKKGIMLLIAVLLFVTQAFAGDNTTTDVAGFRAYKWGDAPAVLGDNPKVAATFDDRQEKTLEKADESLKVGDIPLKKITYTFFNDRLYMVTVQFSEEYADTLLQVLKEKYGPIEVPNVNSDYNILFERDYEWHKGCCSERASFKYSPKIVISNNDIKAEQEAYIKQKRLGDF
jgi:hypothetical protein